MYLTSFVHRDEFFDIVERWLCGRLAEQDGLRLTQILISDGYILGQTLRYLIDKLLSIVHGGPIVHRRVSSKGELRDVICRGGQSVTERERELFDLYLENPDFFYREAPIDGFMCLDGSSGHLIGLYRIKRARRIAEKANRKIARWIFEVVQQKAQLMAEQRARSLGIPLSSLVTPESEMVREFIEAEKAVCQGFSRGELSLDKAALTIHDVGGLKIIGTDSQLQELEAAIDRDQFIKIVEAEAFDGDYRAKSYVLETQWDRKQVFQAYRDEKAWERYRNRGIPEHELQKGLESLLNSPRSTVNVELILSNFPDLVESELGNSIHEQRITSQRDNKTYKGYIPSNVEFLLEYIFAVGFSPTVKITSLPVKLGGRYLPDTLINYIRRLYNLPDQETFY